MKGHYDWAKSPIHSCCFVRCTHEQPNLGSKMCSFKSQNLPQIVLLEFMWQMQLKNNLRLVWGHMQLTMKVCAIFILCSNCPPTIFSIWVWLRNFGTYYSVDDQLLNICQKAIRFSHRQKVYRQVAFVTLSSELWHLLKFNAFPVWELPFRAWIIDRSNLGLKKKAI